MYVRQPVLHRERGILEKNPAGMQTIPRIAEIAEIPIHFLPSPTDLKLQITHTSDTTLIRLPYDSHTSLIRFTDDMTVFKIYHYIPFHLEMCIASVICFNIEPLKRIIGMFSV